MLHPGGAVVDLAEVRRGVRRPQDQLDGKRTTNPANPADPGEAEGVPALAAGHAGRCLSHYITNDTSFSKLIYGTPCVIDFDFSSEVLMLD